MAFIWDKNTGKIGPVLVKVSSSPSYTLAELEQLAWSFVNETPGGMIERLSVSLFLAWLAKREQGKRDER